MIRLDHLDWLVSVIYRRGCNALRTPAEFAHSSFALKEGGEMDSKAGRIRRGEGSPAVPMAVINII